MAVIECAGCGVVIKELTDAEAADVARSPIEYTAFCRECSNDIGGLVGE